MNLSSSLACLRNVGIGLTLASGSTGGAVAAERFVRLDVPRPVAKDLSAYPRIADPADAAERKINAALARLDAKVRKAAEDCRKDAMDSPAGTGSWWERTVRVPMHGPRYVSYVVTDNTFCGGAHPSVSTMAIVYDLTTGNPIDWAALLPPSYAGKPALSDGADGTKMIALSGKALYAAYLRRYRPEIPRAKEKTEDAECREAVSTAGSDGRPPGMMAWLDAKQAALVAYFDLSHAVQACAEEVAIPLAELRKAEVGPRLVDAIEAARRDR